MRSTGIDVKTITKTRVHYHNCTTESKTNATLHEAGFFDALLRVITFVAAEKLRSNEDTARKRARSRPWYRYKDRG